MNVSPIHGSNLQLNNPNGSARNTLTSATVSNFLQKTESGPFPPDNPPKIPAPLRTFLMKAKNGTVSKTDLQDMQAQLSKIPDDVFNQNSGSNDIGKFLAKVKSGNVTDDDLKNIKTALSNGPDIG